MKIEFSDVELRGLTKALSFLRYECTDKDAAFFAGSPHLAAIHKRVSDATTEYYRAHNIPFSEGWPEISSVKGYLDVVKTRIKQTSNWNSLSRELKESFLRTMIYPYATSDQMIRELLTFGDESHK